MTFWLGTHQVSWLGRPEFARVPLFLSAVRLRDRRTLPRAAGRWALDSGGFSELSLRGWWTVPARRYVAEVRRWSEQAGRPPDWAAVQDWMCEPQVRGRTGLSVASHQTLTCLSFEELRQLAPGLPWVPVLQGWSADDYERHADQFEARGADLAALPVVGVGSVCRRQGTAEAEAIVTRLARRGLRLHAFGVKVAGLTRYGGLIGSADSMAWSFNARRNAPLPGHPHKNCANCPEYALRWRRDKVMPLMDNLFWGIPDERMERGRVGVAVRRAAGRRAAVRPEGALLRAERRGQRVGRVA